MPLRADLLSAPIDIEGLKKPFWKGWKRIVLRGNHEDIMWQTCRQLPHAGWWMQNGGGATLMSYGQKEGEWANVKVVPDHHLDWIAGLPLSASKRVTIVTANGGSLATLSLSLRSHFRSARWSGGGEDLLWTQAHARKLL